jgi:hypothetical protein
VGSAKENGVEVRAAVQTLIGNRAGHRSRPLLNRAAIDCGLTAGRAVRHARVCVDSSYPTGFAGFSAACRTSLDGARLFAGALV